MAFDPSEKHPSQVPSLKQQLGPFQFFAIAFGSIIGVGWMIVVGDWLQSAGPLGVSLAFLGSAGMIVLVGLCYAELATMLPVAGGEIAYTYLTSGPFLAYGWAGFWCWAMWRFARLKRSRWVVFSGFSSRFSMH